eukprot:1020546-Amphidinium_carterae.1
MAAVLLLEPKFLSARFVISLHLLCLDAAHEVNEALELEKAEVLEAHKSVGAGLSILAFGKSTTCPAYPRSQLHSCHSFTPFVWEQGGAFEEHLVLENADCRPSLPGHFHHSFPNAL